MIQVEIYRMTAQFTETETEGSDQYLDYIQMHEQKETNRGIQGLKLIQFTETQTETDSETQTQTKYGFTQTDSETQTKYSFTQTETDSVY